MLIAEVQHFILRLAAFAQKSGLFKKDRIRLFHPKSKLHFGGQLAVGVYKDIFLSQHYRCPRPLPDDARIVDGGANVGLSSLYFLNHYPNARVEAYEANPQACALLAKTLASTNFSTERYTVHGNALHIENCELPFYVDPDNSSAVNSSVAGRDNMKTRGMRIDVSAVDIRTLLQKPIDLLKLDVEGHEYVLLDVPEITPETVRAMVIEFHEMADHQEECRKLFSRFSTAGYQIEFAENPALDALAPSSWNGTHIIRIYAP